ncbi:phosphate signaling complex protein PhoU [Chromatiaceae bacterium AAb-1]|nr:phosphate signaling complex protein PhoU [Chromatiaceae bacterium AAb-1]
MPNDKITGHYSQAYDAELQQVVERLLEMGTLVQQQLADALQAFINGDLSLAQQVVETDRTVNRFEVDIDEQCLEILVRRQPAANDLRLILAVLKSINDVERIGDHAENIAQHLLDATQSDRPQSAQLDDIQQMGQRVSVMLQQALESFEKMDAAAALAVLHQDKAIDSDYDRILRHNLTYMLEDTRQISSGLQITWVARALERIGDHARNICQYSIFMAKGQNVTHLSDEELQQVVDKQRS